VLQDITPPAICAWLKQPVVRVHVLLDQRGKTLSHAFVELATEEYARAALRGAQNSVLGTGKRARGVTVTRSSQEELMRAVWYSLYCVSVNLTTFGSYSPHGRAALRAPDHHSLA